MKISALRWNIQFLQMRNWEEKLCWDWSCSKAWIWFGAFLSPGGVGPFLSHFCPVFVWEEEEAHLSNYSGVSSPKNLSTGLVWKLLIGRQSVRRRSCSTDSPSAFDCIGASIRMKWNRFIALQRSTAAALSRKSRNLKLGGIRQIFGMATAITALHGNSTDGNIFPHS